MKLYNLKDMVRGWIVGNFDPSVYKTDKFEVGIKKYKAGDYEASHKHMLAEEITVIVSGKVLMNNKEYSENDIILIEKNECTDFFCLTDVTTCVIKTNSTDVNDKYNC